MTQPYPTYQFYTPDVMLTVVIALAERFTHLKVRRYESDWATVVKEIPVGLNTLVPTKMQLERIEDYSSQGGRSRFYQTVPFMNLNLTGLSLDTSRARGSNDMRNLYIGTFGEVTADNIISDMTPSPWNFDFTLTVKTESYEDSSQILEQILPYFSDENFLRVRDIPFLNVERNLKVVLNNVSPDIPESFGEEEMRVVNWTINFTVHGWLYRPIADVALIERIRVIVNTIEPNGNLDNDMTYTLGAIRMTDWLIVDNLLDLQSQQPFYLAESIVINGVPKIRYKQTISPLPTGSEFIGVDSQKNIVQYRLNGSI